MSYVVEVETAPAGAEVESKSIIALFREKAEAVQFMTWAKRLPMLRGCGLAVRMFPGRTDELALAEGA